MCGSIQKISNTNKPKAARIPKNTLLITKDNRDNLRRLINARQDDAVFVQTSENQTVLAVRNDFLNKLKKLPNERTIAGASTRAEYWGFNNLTDQGYGTVSLEPSYSCLGYDDWRFQPVEDRKAVTRELQNARKAVKRAETAQV